MQKLIGLVLAVFGGALLWKGETLPGVMFLAVGLYLIIARAKGGGYDGGGGDGGGGGD